MGVMTATAEDYSEVLHGLRPPGPAMAGEDAVLAGLAPEFARAHNRLADLVLESDPRTTYELLTEWERAFGLPDGCVDISDDLVARINALVARVRGAGSPTPQYFIDLAATVGYDITITELQPHTVDSPVDYPLYAEDIRYVWQVNSTLNTITYADVNSTVETPLASWGNSILECVITRAKPAHTHVQFSYSGSSFGDGGIFMVQMRPGEDSVFRGIAQQADGYLVAAGDSGGMASICRLATDGSLDPTFGASGIATYLVGDGLNNYASVVIQSDGKAVVAGAAYSSDSTVPFLLRYTTAGVLDTAFGAGGLVDDPMGPSTAGFQSVLIQPDGQIIAGGWCEDEAPKTILAIARYNDYGVLDTGFGTAGVTTTDIAGSTGNILGGIALQPDGKILAAGYIGTSSDAMVFVARYGSAGALDSAFGTGGIALYSEAGLQCLAEGLVLQADGKIAVVGHRYDGVDYYPAIWRFNSDGSIDSGFGSGGLVELPDPGLFRSVIQQADGALVATGHRGNGLAARFLTVRFNPDGGLDSSFGAGGLVITDVDGAQNNDAYAVLQLDDGKIVSAGRASSGPELAAIVRYLDDGSLDGVPTP